MREPWMSTEEWLVVQLCEGELSDNTLEIIEKIARTEPIDLDKLREICIDQKLYSQYMSALRRSALKGLADPKEIEKAEKYPLIMKYQFLRYKIEMLKIQRYLEANGIASVFFKGLSYVPYFYPKEESRQLGDFDIIVKPEDLIKAVHLFKDLGYEEDVKTRGWSDAMYEEEMRWNVHIAILKKDSFELEVHSADYYYSGLHLRYVLERRIQTKEGLYFPCNMDIFFIACVHAWHHFPKRKSQIEKEFVRLRNLLDVWITFEKLRETYSAQDLLESAEKEHISDIMKITVLSSFNTLQKEKNRPEWIKTADGLLNWYIKGQKLSTAFRMLRHEETIKAMKSWFRERERKIIISHNALGASVPQTLKYSLKLIEHGTDSNGWANNILKVSAIPPGNTSISFELSYSSAGIMLVFDSSGNVLWDETCSDDGQNKSTLNPYASYLLIRYSGQREQEPKILIIQQNEEDVHLFRRSFMNETYQDTQYIPHICGKKINLHRAEIALPWSILELEGPKDPFYMDFQARIVFSKNNEYAEISYGSGNLGCLWNENKDSLDLLQTEWEA